MTLVEDQDSNYWLLFPPELSMPVAGDNVEIVESFTYPCVDIRNTASSQHDIRKRIAIACNCMASLDIWHSSIALRTKLQLVSLHPSCHSLWSRNMVPYLTTREESGCVWPMVSVCGTYYEFPGRRTFLMKRQKFFGHIAHADPSMHHSWALRASMAPLPSDWTTDWANCITSGSALLNPIWDHSTLVWQPPIVECRIIKPGACS